MLIRAASSSNYSFHKAREFIGFPLFSQTEAMSPDFVLQYAIEPQSGYAKYQRTKTL